MIPRIIGIAGASGSGKTTVANNLLAHFTTENCLIISTDNYYKDQTGIPEGERHKTNYDHPDSIDFKLLAAHLKDLLSGNEVSIPSYDFKLCNRVPAANLVKPKPFIIIEGILTLHAAELAGLLDLKIFVKADLYKSFQRRKHRDILERGRTGEQVDQQFLTTVWPMYDQFVEPSKDNADMVLKNVAKDNRFNMTPLIQAINDKFNIPTEQQRSYFLFQKVKIKLVSVDSAFVGGINSIDASQEQKRQEPQF